MNKPPVWVSIAIPLDFDSENNKLLLWMQTRKEEGRLNGKLEFPGGKIEDGESPEEAVKREVKEETGVGLAQSVQFKIYKYEYEDRSVVLNTFLVPMNSFTRTGVQEFSLSRKYAGKELNIPEANQEIINDLFEYTKRNSKHLGEVLPWIQ